MLTLGAIFAGIAVTPAPGIIAGAAMLAGDTTPGICCIGTAAFVAAVGITPIVMFAGGTAAGNTVAAKGGGTTAGLMGALAALELPIIGAAAVVAATAALTAVAAILASGCFTAAAAGNVFNGSIGLILPVPVGVMVGVVPTAISDDNSVGGKAFGTSIPRSFKLINLQAILNS